MKRCRTALAMVLLAPGLAMATVDFGPDFVPSQQDNMNGEYVFSTTPGGTPGLFPKQFKDYPGGVESFDVYSPAMTTLYSQVWWSPLAPAELPADVVQKYAGKGMAIVGWEIDQVRRTADGDVSVPISACYNHHYVAQMIGAKAKFNKVMLDGPDDPRAASLLKSSGHGMISYDQPHYMVQQIADSDMPTSQQFSSANGGEYRKTYHGFTPGYVLVVDSPTALQISPMQIDTWNRDEMNISSSSPTRFVPGPLPRSALSPPNAEYSGLLECPMTTRITKEIEGDYLVLSEGQCSQPILTFQECYHAAAVALGGAGRTFLNRTLTDPALPSGCTVNTLPAPHSPLQIQVTFNSQHSNPHPVQVTFNSQHSNPHPVQVTFNSQHSSTSTCAHNSPTITGAASSLVSLVITLDSNNQQATVTVSGPSDVWFGVGFNATAMADTPWTIVMEADGNVSEHKLGNQAPGTVLGSSVVVVSNIVSGSLRTVVMTRPFKGKTSQYYTFNPTSGTIPFINAVGSGPKYAYHKSKLPSSISLLPVGTDAAGACICPEQPKKFGQASGSLVYHPVANQSQDTGSGAVGFGAGKCKDWPSTNLMQQQNPTCDIRHYKGGQWACHHMWSLLDADQPIPWSDQPLVFHHKYRFWVQPFQPSYHTPLVLGETVGSALLIGSPWEYDVPECDHGVPGCSLVKGTWIHTVVGSTMGQHNFSALNFHCHAPTCLSMEVYRCDRSVSVGDCNSSVGELICREEPVYGGTQAPAINATRFDEPGYIAIPDCFWGPAEFGLEAPPDLTGWPLHMVKTANATWGHYGEMAGGQPWVFG